MKEPELVTATQDELDELLRLAKTNFPTKQYELLEGVLATFVYVMLKLQNAKTSIKRFQRMLFGHSTEHKRNVLERAAGSAQPGRAIPREVELPAIVALSRDEENPVRGGPRQHRVASVGRSPFRQHNVEIGAAGDVRIAVGMHTHPFALRGLDARKGVVELAPVFFA